MESSFDNPAKTFSPKLKKNFAPRSLQVIQKLWIFIIDIFSSNFISRKVERSFSNCAEGSLSMQGNVCSKTDFFRQNPNMKEKLSFLSFLSNRFFKICYDDVKLGIRKPSETFIQENSFFQSRF